jgi:hypothetical protein
MLTVQAGEAVEEYSPYNNLIVKGVPLRVVEVRIVSFDSNQFLVEERKFQNLV